MLRSCFQLHKMKLTAFLYILSLVDVINSTGLNVLYQWKYLDWIWPNVALTSKNFTYGNPFTQDVDVDFKSRIFVTTPQWLKGTPITLSTLTNVHGPGGPLLTPYPHWTWHTLYDCNKIISVYRIAVSYYEC